MEARLIEFIVSLVVVATITFLDMLSKMLIGEISDSERLSEITYTVTDNLSTFALSLTFLAFFAYRVIPDVICPARNLFPLTGPQMFVLALCLEFLFFLISIRVKGEVLRKNRDNHYHGRSRRVAMTRIFFWNLSGILSLSTVGILLLLGRF